MTGLRSTSDLDLSWAIDLPRLNLCHEFAWSPGGKAIACRNTNPRIPEPQNVVYLIYPDLGTLRRITTPPGQYLLAWMPLITD